MSERHLCCLVIKALQTAAKALRIWAVGAYLVGMSQDGRGKITVLCLRAQLFQDRLTCAGATSAVSDRAWNLT